MRRICPYLSPGLVSSAECQDGLGHGRRPDAVRARSRDSGNGADRDATWTLRPSRTRRLAAVPATGWPARHRRRGRSAARTSIYIELTHPDRATRCRCRRSPGGSTDRSSTTRPTACAAPGVAVAHPGHPHRQLTARIVRDRGPAHVDGRQHAADGSYTLSPAVKTTADPDGSPRRIATSSR